MEPSRYESRRTSRSCNAGARSHRESQGWPDILFRRQPEPRRGGRDRLTSVGVDIGSSTAHLMFSRITLERLDTRYVVAAREVLYASDILLTPYLANGDIDTDTLAAFIDWEYASSGSRATKWTAAP